MEKRVIIAIVLSIAVLYGYQYFLPQPPPANVAAVKAPAGPVATPGAPPAKLVAASAKDAVPAKAERLTAPAKDVVVDTALYHAVFNSRGGTLRSLVLKKYHESEGPGGSLVTLVAEAPPEFEDLRTESQDFGLGADEACSSSSDGFSLGGVEKKELTFTCPGARGITLKKTFTIDGGSYAMALNEQLVNTGSNPMKGIMRLVLNHHSEPNAKVSRFEEHGPVTYAGKDVDVLKPKDLAKGPKNYGKDVHWTGYGDKYFLSAVIDGTGSFDGVTVTTDKGYVENIISSPAVAVSPGASAALNYRLYFGPKDLDILKAQGSGLEKVIDLGWFSAVAKPLLYTMKFLYRYVHNYGVAIIIITVLIKVIFYPLTYKSYKSMKDMQKLQPKMAELKEKYKNDKEGMNKAVMQLYQTHKVNPLGGCLPMLIQLPIFVALYRALMSSIELRHAPFIFWIQDLSAKDPYYVTPLVMGATMFIQQKMTPSSGMDPNQAKMMLALPVVFTVMFINMPSGLVVYWLVNNILTIAQQAYINKLLKEKG
jgi:YidC/Oxa1 family membrane protein insertase